MDNRRSFLSRLAGGVAALIVAPAVVAEPSPPPAFRQQPMFPAPTSVRTDPNRPAWIAVDDEGPTDDGDGFVVLTIPSGSGVEWMRVYSETDPFYVGDWPVASDSTLCYRLSVVPRAGCRLPIATTEGWHRRIFVIAMVNGVEQNFMSWSRVRHLHEPA